jgi:hypothetical protein
MFLFATRHRTRSDTCGPWRTSPAARRPFAARPRLEVLETRVVLSTLIVANTNDSGLGSLRAAITAAVKGDTVDLSNLGGQTIELTSGEVVLNKSLTIQGTIAPNAPVTIDGVFSRVFEVDGTGTNVALNNLDLSNGDGRADNPASAGAVDGQGGAIWNGGTLTLTTCNLSGNQSATQGGAIWNGGTLILTACNLTSNTCYSGALDDVAFGGAIYNAGTLSISRSTLSDNSAGGYPSGISLLSQEAGDGGAIYNAGTMSVTDSSMSGNHSYYFGAGIGGLGGAIFNAYKTSASITGKDLSGNATEGYGGAIYNEGTLTLTGVTVSGNVAVYGDGGAIWNGGTLTLTSVTVSGNSSGRFGGGIYNWRVGHVTIQFKSSITNNSLYDLYNLGQVKISKDSIVGVTVK